MLKCIPCMKSNSNVTKQPNQANYHNLINMLSNGSLTEIHLHLMFPLKLQYHKGPLESTIKYVQSFFIK